MKVYVDHSLLLLLFFLRRYGGGEDESETIQPVLEDRSGQSTTAIKGQTKVTTVKSLTKVTTMLLVVSFAWLVLTTPFAVYGLVVAVADIDADLIAVLMPLKAVSFLLLYKNHAVNFYLYCLTGCRFRQELVDMLAGWKRTVVGRCRGQHRLHLSLRRSTKSTTIANAAVAARRCSGTVRSEHV